MSQLVSILYICDSCRKIKHLDISIDKLVQEGDLYKITDVHGNHDAILHLNSKFGLERVINKPPVPPLDEPIIKGHIVQKVEEIPTEPQYEGLDRIYIPTRDPKRVPVQVELHKLIVLNMNGINTLADLYNGLSPDWPELTPEYILSLIHNLKIRGWIKEKPTEE